MFIALLSALLLATPSPGASEALAPTELELRVEDARTGEPLAGVMIRLEDQDRSGLSDADGRLRLSGLEPGPVRIRAEAPGYAPLELVLELPSDGLRHTLELERRVVLLAGVRATGTPLRGGSPYQPGQAFDREELTRRAATSLGQMLDGEPGLAMRSFGPVNGRPVIRGLDGDRVAVLENGQRMGDMSETAPDHAVTMDPLGTARVEVIRGPASLLYGSSALGGVVNLLRDDIPRSWAPGTDAGVAVQGATANRQEAISSSGIHAGEGWALTARGALRTSGDVSTPGSDTGILEDTWSRSRSGSVGAAVRGDRIRAGASLDLNSQSFAVPEALEDPDERVELRTNRQRMNAELDWERTGFIEILELRAAVARYGQQEIEVEGLLGPMPGEEVEHDFDRRTLDLGVTAIHGTLGPISAGALGLSLLSQSLEVSGEDEFHPDGTLDAVGLFTFQEVPAGEAVAVQFGVRGEISRTRARPNEFFSDVEDSRTEATFSASLGVRVDAGSSVVLGAQVARAHRAPRLEELFADGPHLGAGRYEMGTPDLANEIGHGVDGYARLDRGWLRGELALFWNRIEDFVVATPTGDVESESGLPVVVWTPVSADLRGGEAWMEVEPVSGLSLRVTADAVRGERGGSDGGPLSYMPPNRLSSELRYDTGEVWVGLRGRLAGAQDRVHREDPTDGYGLLDLSFGVRPSTRQLIVVRLDNALDTAYRDHLSRVEGRRFPMPGRSLSMIWRWSPGAR